MTDDRDRQVQEPKDWRNKGLGWVPDYPDARDYTLSKQEIQKNGRFRRDEITISIETLADAFVETLNFIEKDSSKKSTKLSKPDFKGIKENIEKKVFGSFFFDKVRIHKILRQGDSKGDAPKGDDILQLKHCLSLLRYHTILTDFRKRFENSFDNKKTFLEWIKNNNFDETTTKVVQEFQDAVDIKVDGVVGLETYSAIEDYLLYDDKKPEEKKLSRIKLISVPSFISDDSFSVIFKKLTSWWKEFTGSQQSFQEIYPAIYDKNTGRSQEIFKEIFHREFSTVEPLVSAIFKTLYPLAQYDDLTWAVEKGLNYFHDIILDKNDSESSTSDPSSEFSAIDNKSDHKIAREALQKMKNLIDYEKENFTEKTKESTKQFYNFIDLIVRKYMEEGHICRSDEPSYLDKTYFIELEKSVEDTQRLTFFTPGELYLPLSRSLYAINDLSSLSDRGTYPKLYFFLPSIVDLSYWCSPVEDQGSLNSCAAFAGIALFEYFARKSLGEHLDISPLFLYKVARNLMQSTGDTGASVRETMRGMAAFGVPPEKYWPYEEENFDEEPPAFCYSYAQNYQTLKYFRLDYGAISTEMLLFRVRAVLAAGFPCMFGFTAYRSIYKPSNTERGYIPYPSERDEVVGGHVAVAVGYDDYKEIEDADDKEGLSGALLIRNSWGTQWGRGGYGWLPYKYVLKGLTADWWSLLKAEWFEAGNFGLGAWDPGQKNGNEDQL